MLNPNFWKSGRHKVYIRNHKNEQQGTQSGFKTGDTYIESLLSGEAKRYRIKVDYTLDGRELLVFNPIQTTLPPFPETIVCKNCGSDDLYRHGFTKAGVQRFKCKNCGSTFIDSDALPRMRVPVETVGAAVGMFYEGLSLNAIRRQIDQIYDFKPSDSTVYYWVVRFTEVAVKEANDKTPKVGDTWVADETVLKIGGRNTWFWDVIDTETRFLLASHISQTRYSRDAKALMDKAFGVAGKTPKLVLTDKLRAYLSGIEDAYGADTTHIQSGPFKVENSTRDIERFHGTLKQRTKVMRGMQNRETAKLITDGWLVHYNYLRGHEGLGGETPTRISRVSVPFKNWTDVVRRGV